MKKKLVSAFLASVIAVLLTACGGEQDSSSAQSIGNSETEKETEESAQAVKDEISDETAEEGSSDDFHIGIVTGSFSQSEDDRRGAEAFQEKYGADRVTLAIYPDNFTEELETTVQIIVNLADDPDMKAIIVNQAVDGTTEAFRQIKEKRPDILCIAGEAYEDFSEIGEVADLVVNYDFISRGYLMIHTAHELSCDTFVHISFPRHLSYESVSRQIAIMKAACEEFGMRFVMEEAPDPTTEVAIYMSMFRCGWINTDRNPHIPVRMMHIRSRLSRACWNAEDILSRQICRLPLWGIPEHWIWILRDRQETSKK